MDRDIIVIWSNYDITYVTLNGLEIKYGMERGYEIGDILIGLFDNLKHSYNKPLTDDELQVLNDTEDVEQFINKIKENLQPRASELDKEIQEM